MVTCTPFDVFDGQQIYKYTITDKITVEVVSFGATLVSVKVPNRHGSMTDVLLGLTSSQSICQSQAYMGSVVGRCCNRIAKGRFLLEGKEYLLAINNGENHLHGGNIGFNKKIFHAKVEGNGVVFSCFSPDGDENYPGNLQFSVKYSVCGSALVLDYLVQSDATTICNPTNHAYFNLDGQDSGSISQNILQIFANEFLPVSETLIPTGEKRSVLGTPFDFTLPKPIGQDIDFDDIQLKIAGGYDHNYCLRKEHFATVYSSKTGVQMDCYTDAVGVQFYSGNFISGERGKALYNRRSGFCLETQFYPDAINHKSFRQPILNAGEQLRTQTRYEFSVK